MTPDLLVHILLTGVGATLCMDLWALLLKRRFGIPSSIMRWWAAGFSACSTAAGFTPPSLRHRRAGERTIGWILHYAVGIAFAFIPIGLAGIRWYTAPEPLIALLSGWLSRRRRFW